MNGGPQCERLGVTITGVPRERPVFYPDLGDFFVRLRTSHRWSMRQAAQSATNKQLGVTRQVLLRLEHGQIKNPEPDLLRAVAALYSVRYEELAGLFIQRIYAIDLPRHSGVNDESARVHRHSPEIGDIDAQARTLLDLTARYDALLADAEAARNTLDAAIARVKDRDMGQQTGFPPGKTPQRRRRR